MSNMIYKKKKSFGKYIILLLLVAIVGAGVFLFISPAFEKNPPNITLYNQKFWNLKEDIEIDIEDDSGIRYLRVTFDDGKKQTVLQENVYESPKKSLSLKLSAPKLDMFFKAKKVTIEVEAVDSSRWNFFEGNKKVQKFDFEIDNKRPTAKVIANSLAIKKGGSAIAVVQVEDKNLQNAYIQFNDTLKLELIPYKHESYYVSLIPWPVDIKEFEMVSLIAIDKANNKTRTKIPLYIRKLQVNDDHITIKDKFIDTASANVLELSGFAPIEDKLERFLTVNRQIREKNVNTIREVVVSNMDKSLTQEFELDPFKRLRGSKTFAGFADKRHYYYKGDKVDEAWHLGIDWASVQNAPIRTSNSGRVIYNEYLGIYGNSVIIDHKFGLATLYAHVSSSDVEVGQMVNKRQKIANTGSTGAVFGDHLHFGVLVQGIEVNPVEWMDRNWIKTRITDILKEADLIIKERQELASKERE